MNNRQKHSNAIAYLRQLCCSGLDKEIVIAEFLRAVQAVIPSGSNVFTGLDAQLNLYHIPEFIIADLAEITPTIVSSYFTGEIKSRTLIWLKQDWVIADIATLDDAFYKSDLYNLIYRPYDQYHTLWGLVLHSKQPIGILILHRPCQQKPFNDHDKTLCKQLLPYLAHALHDSDTEYGIRNTEYGIRNTEYGIRNTEYGIRNTEYSESGLPGMMIMDTNGQIQYLSHEAKQLLILARYPVLSQCGYHQEVELFAKLAQLCRNLHTIFQGQHASPPSWTHSNGRGRFIFTAYWLSRFDNESGNLINITINHQEPLKLKILRALQELPLSAMQKQVAFAVAQGLSNEKIGECFNIKLTTVKDHISKIFDKLDIEHRNDLLPLLLSLDKRDKMC